jgi:hypothetical protein
MMDATLGTAVVDDLFGIRPVAPTSRFPNADVGILDRQQRNVIVVVAVIKLVQPRNVVEIMFLTPESSVAAASPMSFRPLSGFRRLINLTIPSKHNASG